MASWTIEWEKRRQDELNRRHQKAIYDTRVAWEVVSKKREERLPHSMELKLVWRGYGDEWVMVAVVDGIEVYRGEPGNATDVLQRVLESRQYKEALSGKNPKEIAL